MLEPFASSFLSPTRESRRLSILLAIHANPRASQHRLAGLTGLSSAMVNNYVRELQGNGLLLVSGDTNRTQNYHLTATGTAELQKLLQRYDEEINTMHGNVPEEITKIRLIRDALKKQTGT